MEVTVASHSCRAAVMSLKATVMACPCRTSSAFSSRISCNSCLVTLQPFIVWLYCDCRASYSLIDTHEESINTAAAIAKICFISGIF